MNEWDFEKRKQFILKNCNFKGWDGYDSEPTHKNWINQGIKTANEIREYFEEHQINIKEPFLSPLGDLDFQDFEKGFTIVIDFHEDNPKMAAYGQNKCRNWDNHEEIEFNISNAPITRTILGLFAKWLKEKKAEFIIEVQKERDQE